MEIVLLVAIDLNSVNVSFVLKDAKFAMQDHAFLAMEINFLSMVFANDLYTNFQFIPLKTIPILLWSC